LCIEKDKDSFSIPQHKSRRRKTNKQKRR